MAFRILTLIWTVLAIVVGSGYSETARAECVTPPSISLGGNASGCYFGNAQQIAACQAQEQQERAQQEAGRRNQYLQCQERERIARQQAAQRAAEDAGRARLQDEAQRKAAAQRASDELARQRAAAAIAQQKAQQAAADLERQRAEVQKAQLLAAAEKARADAAEADRKRRAAESPIGLSMLTPNSMATVAAGVALGLLFAQLALVLNRLFNGDRSAGREILIQSAASIVSGIVLGAAGLTTDYTLLTVPILSGAASMGLTVSLKHA